MINITRGHRLCGGDCLSRTKTVGGIKLFPICLAMYNGWPQKKTPVKTPTTESFICFQMQNWIVLSNNNGHGEEACLSRRWLGKARKKSECWNGIYYLPNLAVFTLSCCKAKTENHRIEASSQVYLIKRDTESVGTCKLTSRDDARKLVVKTVCWPTLLCQQPRFFFFYLLLNVRSTRKHLDSGKIDLKVDVLSLSPYLLDPRDKQERFTWEKMIVSICGEVEDFISFSTEF